MQIMRLTCYSPFWCNLLHQEKHVFFFSANNISLFFSLFIDEKKVTSDVKNHLRSDTSESVRVGIYAYHEFDTQLERLADDSVNKIWVSWLSNPCTTPFNVCKRIFFVQGYL